MKECTFVPKDTGEYPSDTIAEETTVQDVSQPELDKIIRELKTYKEIHE